MKKKISGASSLLEVAITCHLYVNEIAQAEVARQPRGGLSPGTVPSLAVSLSGARAGSVCGGCSSGWGRL